MRSGVSTMIVSIGTCRRSCSKSIAMRRMVAVEAPDAAQACRAAGVGLAQPADERQVKRAAPVARLLGGVDHQLLPYGQSLLVGRREWGRRRQQLPVSLAHADSLEREQRPAKQRAEVRQHRGDLLAGADRDDHHRHLGIASEEAGSLAHAVGGAVDAEQRGRAGDAPAMQQVADRHERRNAARLLPTPDVDSQLGRLVKLLGQRRPARCRR